MAKKLDFRSESSLPAGSRTLVQRWQRANRGEEMGGARSAMHVRLLGQMGDGTLLSFSKSSCINFGLDQLIESRSSFRLEIDDVRLLSNIIIICPN